LVQNKNEKGVRPMGVGLFSEMAVMFGGLALLTHGVVLALVHRRTLLRAEAKRKST